MISRVVNRCQYPGKDDNRDMASSRTPTEDQDHGGVNPAYLRLSQRLTRVGMSA